MQNERKSKKKPPHPPLRSDLFPRGEVCGGSFSLVVRADQQQPLPWGRGRREAAGEGAFLFSQPQRNFNAADSLRGDFP
jgi:hypothetical protein